MRPFDLRFRRGLPKLHPVVFRDRRRKFRFDDKIEAADERELCEVGDQISWQRYPDRHASLLRIKEQPPVLDTLRPELCRVNDSQTGMEQ